jgi:hypothetical protein
MNISRRSIAWSTTTASLTRKLSLACLLTGCLVQPGWAKIKSAEISGNPTINDDRVTVRIKVKNPDGKPVMGLNKNDFKLFVDNQELKFKSKDWKNPEQATPPPVWIVILLDFSGSMNQPDSTGQPKLAGAVAAIREFVKVLGDRGGDTQISIVPFGEGGKGCEGNPVTKETLDKFFPAGDFKLESYLDKLAKTKPCASTNLYDPVIKSLQFFSNPSDSRFSSKEESDRLKPRLSIVLLSDGYQNKTNEPADFKKLEDELKNHEEILVHTLGYGMTPEQLGAKYALGHSATRKDIGKGAKRVPEEEFVDRDRLKQIAQISGGIGEFSGNPKDIASNLKLFLNALLGEYEITYNEPNPERAKKHVISATVQGVKSAEQGYTMTVFGRSLPFTTRLLLFGSTLAVMGLLGVIPFWLWGWKIKNESLSD